MAWSVPDGARRLDGSLHRSSSSGPGVRSYPWCAPLPSIFFSFWAETTDDLLVRSTLARPSYSSCSYVGLGLGPPTTTRLPEPPWRPDSHKDTYFWVRTRPRATANYHNHQGKWILGPRPPVLLPATCLGAANSTPKGQTYGHARHAGVGTQSNGTVPA